MYVFVTLIRREFSSYFLSLTGYVVMATVLLLQGLGFASLLEVFNGTALNAPVTMVFYDTPYFWLIVLLATPVITMRLFAQEKYSGTFETLMTTPVGDLRVVLAKFTAALLFFIVAWLPLLVCLHVVHRYTTQGVPFNWLPVASTYLGIVLLGSLYVAIGCLASSLTRSQIIAATTSLAAGISLFLLSFLKLGLSTQTGWASQVVSHVALVSHMEDFARGVVDTRAVVFYVSATVLLLFATLKVVESRRWK
ncbi:MAG: ABC transporter permease [Limisphaerales bacterium]